MENTKLNLEKALNDARAAVHEGRQVLLKYFKKLKSVREKAHAGLVSEADLESEQKISAYLKSCYPNIPILGEESAFSAHTKKLPGATTWVLDPLDGTTNYVHGFHVFCISLGLVVDGELSLAIVDVPLLKQTYWAIKGQGAFRDSTRLRVSTTQQLSDALLATGFFPDDKTALQQQLRIFSHFTHQVRGIRRAGAAAYDLCLVAEGVFDAFWEKNLSPWDTAAGALLVREAGGRVVNYQGHEYQLEDNSILAANDVIYETVLAQLKCSM